MDVTFNLKYVRSRFGNTGVNNLSYFLPPLRERSSISAFGGRVGGLSKTADNTGDSSKMLTLGKEGMGGIGPGEKYYESWNNTFAESRFFRRVKKHV